VQEDEAGAFKTRNGNIMIRLRLTLVVIAILGVTPIKARDIQDDPRYAPLDAKLNRVYSVVRVRLSSSQKEDLRQLELDFLNRREGLKNDPDAYFAATEQQITTLQGLAAGNELPHHHAAQNFSSPDGKYQLKRGHELIVTGPDTIPVVLEKDLDENHAGPISTVLWSPEGDKIVVVVPHDEGSSSVEIAWLKGNAWKTGDPPDAPNQFEPPHYFGKQDKAVRWLTNDVFEMTSAVIYNSREVQEAIRYKVRVTPGGPQIAE
jgi:hypothetical protein